MLAIDLDIGDVVLENGGDVDLKSNIVRTLSLSSWSMPSNVHVIWLVCGIAHDSVQDRK